jgi:hypothetical protein
MALLRKSDPTAAVEERPLIDQLIEADKALEAAHRNLEVSRKYGLSDDDAAQQVKRAQAKVDELVARRRLEAEDTEEKRLERIARRVASEQSFAAEVQALAPHVKGLVEHLRAASAIAALIDDQRRQLGQEQCLFGPVLPDPDSALEGFIARVKAVGFDV